VEYILRIKKELNIGNWKIRKAKLPEVIDDLPVRGFDLVFADPPYMWPGIHNLVQLLVSGRLSAPDGIVVIEHHKNLIFDVPELKLSKTYGDSSVSIFKPNDYVKNSTVPGLF
jgi:16S rRNA G966 N2-methylase RsmD